MTELLNYWQTFLLFIQVHYRTCTVTLVGSSITTFTLTLF